jgi:hypothetical protein
MNQGSEGDERFNPDEPELPPVPPPGSFSSLLTDHETEFPLVVTSSRWLLFAVWADHVPAERMSIPAIKVSGAVVTVAEVWVTVLRQLVDPTTNIRRIGARRIRASLSRTVAG